MKFEKLIPASSHHRRQTEGLSEKRGYAGIDARRLKPRAPNWEAPRGLNGSSHRQAPQPPKGLPNLEREALASARRPPRFPPRYVDPALNDSLSGSQIAEYGSQRPSLLSVNH